MGLRHDSVRAMPRPASLDRPLPERALAWVYTGPLGHLWSAVADITVLWARWIAHVVRRRVSGSRGHSRSGR
jgi:hypothetical protein